MKLIEGGDVKIYLKSMINQDVTIKSINQTIHFESGERIQTELSTKYNDEKMHKLVDGTSFKMENKIMDATDQFADYIFEYSSLNKN